MHTQEGPAWGERKTHFTVRKSGQKPQAGQAETKADGAGSWGQRPQGCEGELQAGQYPTCFEHFF